MGLFSAVLRALPARVQQSTDPPDPIGVVQAAGMEKGASETSPPCARCGKPAQLQCVFSPPDNILLPLSASDLLSTFPRCALLGTYRFLSPPVIRCRVLPAAFCFDALHLSI